MLPDGKTNKIEIVLNWGENASNLDLHSMQINKEAPGAGCETFFNKMDGCENTKLDGDSFIGGTQGGEKITISNPAQNLKYTYMIFVKDNSANEDELESSDAHIDISDGIKSLSKTLPEFRSNTPSGARFWFVGCLRTIGGSFQFAAVDSLNRDSPFITQKLYCDNIFKKDASVGQEKPNEFCEDISLNVRLQTAQYGAFFSSLEGCGSSCLTVQIVLVENDLEKTIFEGTPASDKVIVPISSNGQYIVKVDGEGYVATEEAFNVGCDISNCRSCNPSFVLPLSPVLAADQVKIMLSWAYLPQRIVLNTLEMADDNTVADIYSTNEKNITLSSTTLSGVSTSMNGKVGMIFVENLDKGSPFSTKSDVGVTITDGTTTSKNKMDMTKYGGQLFWIAGCFKIENGVLNFSPEASFLNTRPDKEVPDYCLRFYRS